MQVCAVGLRDRRRLFGLYACCRQTTWALARSDLGPRRSSPWCACLAGGFTFSIAPGVRSCLSVVGSWYFLAADHSSFANLVPSILTRERRCRALSSGPDQRMYNSAEELRSNIVSPVIDWRRFEFLAPLVVSLTRWFPLNPTREPPRSRMPGFAGIARSWPEANHSILRA